VIPKGKAGKREAGGREQKTGMQVFDFLQGKEEHFRVLF